MANAYVIGASGHVGCYIVPALVDAGYEVTAFSRGNIKPYTADMPQWTAVKSVKAQRDEVISMISSDCPDVIVDTIGYNKADMEKLCNAIYASGKKDTRLIFIGSVWIFGKKFEVPYNENSLRNPPDGYGKGKVEASEYLQEQYRTNGLKMTILHPGHVCGKGWIPVGPQANRSFDVIKTIREGRELILPDLGQATLAHVHSDDIARLTVTCLKNDASIGEEFMITAKKATTLYGLAVKLYQHYGKEPNIKFVPYSDFLDTLQGQDRADSQEHIDRSPCCSMEKAYKLLGFEPVHDIYDTIIESLDSIMDLDEMPKYTVSF